MFLGKLHFISMFLNIAKHTPVGALYKIELNTTSLGATSCS